MYTVLDRARPRILAVIMTAAVALTLTPHPASAAVTVDFVKPMDWFSPVMVFFDGDVTGMTAENLFVRETDSAKPVALSQYCLDAEVNEVSCAGDAVQAALLAPEDVDLIPNQRYTTYLNPDGVTGLVTEVATDEALASDSHTWRFSSPNWPGFAPQVTQRWQTARTRKAHGGSYQRVQGKGAAASFIVTGDWFKLVGVKGPALGKIRVTIDFNTRNAKTLDQFAERPTFGATRTFRGLGAGEHLIMVESTGTRNAKSKGTVVALDRIVDRSGDVEGSEIWRKATTADLAGQTVSMRFRGTSLIWNTVKGPAEGKAKVLIDGKERATVNLYAATRTGFARTFGNLTDAVHTVVIKVLGGKDRRSSGHNVTFKNFRVKS